MKKWWNYINWTGVIGAMILFGYGWLKEPLAAVLGGMILTADLLSMAKQPH